MCSWDHRLEHHGELLREAAGLAEEENACTPGQSKTAFLSHLNHLARTVAMNNVSRALKLISFSEEARKFLEVNGD